MRDSVKPSSMIFSNGVKSIDIVIIDSYICLNFMSLLQTCRVIAACPPSLSGSAEADNPSEERFSPRRVAEETRQAGMTYLSFILPINVKEIDKVSCLNC